MQLEFGMLLARECRADTRSATSMNVSFAPLHEGTRANKRKIPVEEEPAVSMWLSGANAVLGSARGHAMPTGERESSNQKL
jgi:hypothetical protein